MQVQLIRNAEGQVIATVNLKADSGVPVEPAELDPGTDVETIEIALISKMYDDLDRFYESNSK